MYISTDIHDTQDVAKSLIILSDDSTQGPGNIEKSSYKQ